MREDSQESSSDSDPLEDEYDIADASSGEDPRQRGEEPQASSSTAQSEGDEETERAERGGGKASTSEPTGQQKGKDNGLAAAFSEILDHPGPANVKHKAPILLVGLVDASDTCEGLAPKTMQGLA